MSTRQTIDSAARGMLQLCAFRCGDATYAVDIKDVMEITRTMRMVKTPKAPPFVEGIVNLRGQVIPVVDLARRLGEEASARTKDSRIVVMRLACCVAGFVVDAVDEVLRIPATAVETPPDMARGEDADYVAGVIQARRQGGEELVVFLDMNALLCRRQQTALAAMATAATEGAARAF